MGRRHPDADQLFSSQTSCCCSRLLSVCCSIAASSFRASRCARVLSAPCGASVSSSGHDQPSPPSSASVRPLTLRSIVAGSKSRASPSGVPPSHPWQRTRTGYIASAVNPSAQRMREAATSA